MVTDRTQADVEYAKSHPDSTTPLKGAYNYTDLNRVEAKVQELQNILSNYNYTTSSSTYKLDWSYTDKFTPNDAQRYLNNVKKIREAYFVLPTTPAVPGTMQGFTYQRANDLEQVLVDIENIIHSMEDYLVYSGVANSGQNRMWQQRFRRKYNHVLNMLADGRFKNISANYRTNSLARIYNQDNHTTYEMTSDGASGYVYNIYTQATFPLDSTHTYMYIARWRNTEDYPENSLGYYFRNASGGIRNRSFSAHGTEWQTDYDVFSTQNSYTGAYVGINGSNLNQGANLDIQYQALLDVTDLDSNYLEVVKQNIDKMIAFPKVEVTRSRGVIRESEGDLVE